MARKYAIVVGDKTDHGGNTFDSNGKPVARLNDTLICPLCKRTTRIVTRADPASSAANQGIAFDGDLTDCGAKLTAGGQPFIYIDQGVKLVDLDLLPVTDPNLLSEHHVRT